MGLIVDSQRMASVYTTLPEGELVFYSLTGEEALAGGYRFDVMLLSENPNIGLSELLGQPVCIVLQLPSGGYREFNGIVTHFSFAGTVGRHIAYRAIVEPWLNLLAQRVGSRIFQAKTVPKVVEGLFREHGFSDFANELTGEYRDHEYLVQYNESDLRFVRRIMALEGIYFFFKHHDGKHELVLADSCSAHEPAPDYASVPFYPPQGNERRERDHIDSWFAGRELRPGLYSARDFNFTRPAAPVMTEARLPLDHAFNECEIYDYPGQFQQNAEADTQARIRLEEQQAPFERVNGEGNARGLGCGGLFELVGFPREDQNKEYLIIQAAYTIKVGDYDSRGDSDGELEYRVRFVAQDSQTPYRPPRARRAPSVGGPQTAIVVGPADQEIWTDEYGRVRLQFHWDREGQSDENSSCWVRVSQAWAGSNWGSIHIPRIGQEVVVSFLEGDPNRPLVTGRVYNAANMPPYTLPGSQTQSGIKSRSSKDATAENFNEIRFEDKKGQEELHIQAEKNMTTLVKKDQSRSVKGSRSASVDGGDSVSVGGDRSLSVTGKLSVTVKGGESKHDVTGKYILTASDTIAMTATNKITLTCGGSSITMTPDRIVVHAGGGTELAMDANGRFESSQHSKIFLDANLFATASGGAKMLLDSNACTTSNAGSQLLLDANAGIKTTGDVIVDGMNVSVLAKAEAKMACSGSSVAVNLAGTNVGGPMVNVTGQTMCSIGAALIKIG